ncbi:MAG: hypothetical protein Q9174_002975 [Haloplaca sp. 1 TL-2023]
MIVLIFNIRAACTLFTIFLVTLPSPLGADSRFGKARNQHEIRVQVVVLGDLGRSPRIQYHAISIAKHGGFVDLVGYTDSAIHPEVLASSRINVHGIAKTPEVLKTSSKWLFLIVAPIKVFLQACSLYFVLGYRTAPARFLLMQNPPTIPTLIVAQFICFARNTRLIIDWHNFGYSILALKLGSSHPLVRISRRFEQTFSSGAFAHLTVSHAMARVLKETLGIVGPVLPLHDRPYSQFQPLNTAQRSKFLAACPETAAFANDLVSGRTKLLVSSTSWTPDEDFALLLDALVTYSDFATGQQKNLPEILTIVTGKGPLKEAFLSKIKTLTEQGKLRRVEIKTAWLSAKDYAQLLASADLGVSLHMSSSGVDLPMKVVDMLGAGLPVVGWGKYEAWPELIREGHNGRGFGSSAQLTSALVDLFGGDGSALQLLRQGAIRDGKQRWDSEWDPVAGKLLALYN